MRRHVAFGIIVSLLLVGAGCFSRPRPAAPPPAPPPGPITDCTPRGACRNGEPCPGGTSCSGMPAFGCYPDGCPTPICLSADTVIATPGGDMPVTAIVPGTIVWTSDGRGGRLAVPVRSTGSTAAPEGHMVVHLRLSDGREAWTSPNHPTADGRSVGDLAAGDVYDRANVEAAELIPYGHDRTYDLLPAGPTGTYWANDILMGSTLR